MANIGTLTAQIGLNTKGLQAGAAKARGTFSGIEKSATGSFGAITSSIGKMAAAFGAVAVGAKLVGVFKSMVTIGVDFEYTMATVGGIMRATGDEMKDLTAIAKKMGETTEWTASQSGEALKFLGMAGFNAAKAVKALPGVLDLATAGNIELGRAADIASNALTAMGLPVEELTRVNDVFVGTITRSNTNMEMMAESFKYAAPSAKAYGYSIEELSGLIGMLGNAGIQGSMAGTQLAMAFQKAGVIAEKMGLQSSDLLDVLEDLRGKGLATTEIMRMFGLRAGKAVGVLVDRIPEVRMFQDTLTGVGGEAAKLAEVMRSTVKGSFAELKSVIESVAIDAFGRFGGSLSDTLKSMIEWVRENKKQMVIFIEIVTSGLSTVAAVVGRIVEVISTFTGATSDFFDTVDRRMQESAENAVKAGEAIRAALQPPDITGWETFVITLESTLNNLWAVVKLVMRSAGTAIAVMVRTVLYGILIEGLQNVAQAIIDLVGIIAKVPAALAQWSLAPIEKQFNKLKATVAKTAKDMVVNFSAAGESFVANWDKYLTELENRSAEQKAAERFFEKWVEKADEETLKVAQIMMTNLEQAGITLQGTAAQQMVTAMQIYLSPIEHLSRKAQDAIAKTHQDFLRIMAKSSKEANDYAKGVVESTTKVIEEQLAARTQLLIKQSQDEIALWHSKEAAKYRALQAAVIVRQNIEAQANQVSLTEWEKLALARRGVSAGANAHYIAEYRQMANTIVGFTRDMANAMIEQLHGFDQPWKEILLYWVKEFNRLFIRLVLQSIAENLIPGITKQLGFIFDKATNDRMIIREGQRYAMFLQRGAEQELKKYRPTLSVAPVVASVPSVAAATEVTTQQPAAINLHFYGPVSSREFVLNEMIPLIERATAMKQSRIEVKEQMLTGVPDVVFS